MDSVRMVPARPVEDEARLVMSWRNDPVTLAASFDGAPKVWPTFFDEYLGWLRGAPIAPQLGLMGDEPLAFLRFRACPDPENGEPITDLSINVAPHARGRGLGTRFVALASRLALEACPAVLAEIKPGNVASLRAFRAAGYRRVGEAVHLIAGTSVAVERYLLRRGDRDAA